MYSLFSDFHFLEPINYLMPDRISHLLLLQRVFEKKKLCDISSHI